MTAHRGWRIIEDFAIQSIIMCVSVLDHEGSAVLLLAIKYASGVITYRHTCICICTCMFYVFETYILDYS